MTSIARWTPSPRRSGASACRCRAYPCSAPGGGSPAAKVLRARLKSGLRAGRWVALDTFGRPPADSQAGRLRHHKVNCPGRWVALDTFGRPPADSQAGRLRHHKVNCPGRWVALDTFGRPPADSQAGRLRHHKVNCPGRWVALDTFGRPPADSQAGRLRHYKVNCPGRMWPQQAVPAHAGSVPRRRRRCLRRGRSVRAA